MSRYRLCYKEKYWFNALRSVPRANKSSTLLRHQVYNAYPKKGLTLEQILKLPSRNSRTPSKYASVTVILNFYKRESLCVQLDRILRQTVQPTHIWIILFNSPLEEYYRAVARSYNDERISLVTSDYDFKFYGRFQMALQAQTKYVWVIDDDIIPGEKYIEQNLHIIGTREYNGVLGSIGRVLPPAPPSSAQEYASYRHFTKGLYLPDPIFDLIVTRITEVDMLCSMWFMEQDWVRIIFREKELTFETGEDFAISFMLRKYANIPSYVVPVIPGDLETYGDSDHRIASQKAATTLDTIPLRDSIWWRHFLRGGQLMRTPNPLLPSYKQSVDCLIIVDGIHQAKLISTFIKRLVRGGKEIAIAITGGERGSCEEMIRVLPLTIGSSYCKGYVRKGGLFDMKIGQDFTRRTRPVDVFMDVLISMNGILQSIKPASVLAITEIDDPLSLEIGNAVKKAAESFEIVAIVVPKEQVKMISWLEDIDRIGLRNWAAPKVVVTVITMNRPRPLLRLLDSLNRSYYFNDDVSLVVNVDQDTTESTLNIARRFNWPYGSKHLRVRVMKGGLLESVAGSWHPASNNEFGVLLEDDIEVSKFWYAWVKYALLKYRYSAKGVPASLVGISLYTPRIIELTTPRRRWDSNMELEGYERNTPFLYQLPCSWGALYFPEHWAVFRTYMKSRIDTEDDTPLHVVPKSRSTYWKTSWKKFMIDEMYLRGFFMLYPNYFNQTSFSTNHLETGEHISKNSKLAHLPVDYTVPLMKEEDMFYELPDSILPIYENLPMLDTFNNYVNEANAVAAGQSRNLDEIRCPENMRPVASTSWKIICDTAIY